MWRPTFKASLAAPFGRRKLQLYRDMAGSLGKPFIVEEFGGLRWLGTNSRNPDTCFRAPPCSLLPHVRARLRSRRRQRHPSPPPPPSVPHPGLTTRFFNEEQRKAVFAIVLSHLVRSKQQGGNLIAALWWNLAQPGEPRSRISGGGCSVLVVLLLKA